MKKEKQDLAKFLESKFLSWQQELGRRSTLSEFADYLDLDRAQLSLYMNGHTLPKKEVVDRIAKKLGYEIYDLLNLERPDPLVDQFIESITDPTDRDLLQKVMESIGDPAERKFIQDAFNFIQGLDDEGREEFSRYLQSKENALLGRHVKTKPSPKTS